MGGRVSESLDRRDGALGQGRSAGLWRGIAPPLKLEAVWSEVTACACSPGRSRYRSQTSWPHPRRRRRPIAKMAATASIPVADGVLRLDTRTGQASQGSCSDAGWACKVVPDERSALETEGVRLQGAGPALPARLETVRHLAAALGELRHDLLLQPDVHRRRAIEGAGVAELLRQLLTGAEAAVQFQQLHQIDDRAFPIEIFILLVGEFRKDGFDISFRDRLCRRCARRRGGWGWAGRAWGGGCGA